MPKQKWIKQLTRENTLLDRSLRTIAYAESVPEVGQAHVAKCLIIGHGRMISWYYSANEYRREQSIIEREFCGVRIQKMGEGIQDFLEEAYHWIAEQKKDRLNKKEFINYFKEFQQHNAHARGAVVYGYWGEPMISAKLRRVLAKKLSGAALDTTLSVLSTPPPANGSLTKLFHTSRALQQKKKRLLASLRLSTKEIELVTILSWFTFFYELGERVSSLLYDAFLLQLKRQVESDQEFNNLEWYDGQELLRYFSDNKKLTAAELRRRGRCYILTISRGRLQIVSGAAAERYIQKNIKEATPNVPQTTQELKGMAASLGRVTGVVRIVITQEDQKKMNQGDILVSSMTTPRLMAAMHKAGAIVTDEGGLTAHAAIVSRELGIPCIVGTKVATQILKDGDKVEVDANKGIVRKI